MSHNFTITNTENEKNIVNKNNLHKTLLLLKNISDTLDISLKNINIYLNFKKNKHAFTVNWSLIKNPSYPVLITPVWLDTYDNSVCQYSNECLDIVLGNGEEILLSGNTDNHISLNVENLLNGVTFTQNDVIALTIEYKAPTRKKKLKNRIVNTSSSVTWGEDALISTEATELEALNSIKNSNENTYNVLQEILSTLKMIQQTLNNR